MALITADEIIGQAFSRDVSTEKIKSNIIEAVQLRHILPIVGEDFYDAIVAAPSSYTAIVDLIKPALAYFVKYYVLPEIYVEVSTTGVNVLTGQNRSRASEGELNDLRNTTLDMAFASIRRLSKYLDDNSDSYSLYYKAKNADETIKIAGGIIFEDPDLDSDDDDYTQDLKYY